jgi:hypothetical protein
MTAGSAAADIHEGLRRQGRDWASTSDCAALLARVLQEGTAAEIVAVQRALRRYRVAQAARRAVARYERETAPCAALVQRRLTGRELVAALSSWAERDEAAQLEGDRVVVPMAALLRFVATLGDDPRRVVAVLQAAGLWSAEASPTGVVVTIRLPREADAA